MKFRIAKSPRDTLLPSDNHGGVRFNQSCILALAPNLPEGFNCVLAQNGPGQVKLEAGVGASLANSSDHNKLLGDNALACVIVPANADGRSAEVLIGGDTDLYNDTTPWTARTVAANQWTGVAWSPELELFGAVAYSGAQPAMSSPDGGTWTPRTIASAQWTDLIWAPAPHSMFVASGQLGVLTSTDAATWTVNPFIANRFAHGLCYSPELDKFVAIGINSSPYDKFYAFTSSDGLAWDDHLIGNSVNFYPERVTWAAEFGLFLATSDAGLSSDLAYSPDGEDWTILATPESHGGFYGVAYSPELRRAVAVSDYYNKFAWTDDGRNWTFADFPANGGGNWVPITWVPELGLFITAAATGTKRLATSPDGKTWTLRDFGATPTSPAAFAYSPPLGLAVFVDYGGANRVQTSYPL